MFATPYSKQNCFTTTKLTFLRVYRSPPNLLRKRINVSVDGLKPTMVTMEVLSTYPLAN